MSGIAGHHSDCSDCSDFYLVSKEVLHGCTCSHAPIFYHSLVCIAIGAVYISVYILLCTHLYTAPIDYDAVTQTFTFGPGLVQQCATVPIEDDVILEATENFFATLTTTDSILILNPDSTQVDIIEDPNDCKQLGVSNALSSVKI